MMFWAERLPPAKRKNLSSCAFVPCVSFRDYNFAHAMRGHRQLGAGPQGACTFPMQENRFKMQVL